MLFFQRWKSFLLLPKRGGRKRCVQDSTSIDVIDLLELAFRFALPLRYCRCSMVNANVHPKMCMRDCRAGRRVINESHEMRSSQLLKPQIQHFAQLSFGPGSLATAACDASSDTSIFKAINCAWSISPRSANVWVLFWFAEIARASLSMWNMCFNKFLFWKGELAIGGKKLLCLFTPFFSFPCFPMQIAPWEARAPDLEVNSLTL